MILKRPILIVGFGSVGRRHLRNLRELGHKNFVIYSTGKGILPKDEIAGIPQEYDLHKALEYDPIVTIVANPTALHIPIALAAAKLGSHLFLEKPLSHNVDGIKDLSRVVMSRDLVVQVGFQFRFHPGLVKVKQLLESNIIGSVVSVQAHWGEYLPGWHPGEEYQKSYASRKKLGGGVLLTLCHPFDYLRWLLGEVKSVSAQVGQIGGLDINVEDSADVLLKFSSGAMGNVHLDYIQRPSEHFLRIIGQSGTIYWNNADGSVVWQSGKNSKQEKFLAPKTFERNTLFLDEMRHFLSCIKAHKEPLCSLEDGRATLRIILAAKESAKKKQMIKLP